MKKVFVKKITLTNWKAQNTTVEFGERTYISGMNGIGKTSIMKAFCWLMTGYSDPYSQKNSDLFDNKAPITMDTPPAVVECEMSVSGRCFKIRRSAVCKFVRPRGSVEWVKDSTDEYKLYIDDIPYSQTEFESWVGVNICNPKMLMYAINGEFFLDYAMEDRRKAREVLDKVVGGVEISELKGDYTVLDDMLTKYGIDDIERQARTRLQSARNTVAPLNSLIEREQEVVNSLSSMDFDDIRAEIKRNEELLYDMDNGRGGSNDNTLSELRKTYYDESDEYNRAVSQMLTEASRKVNEASMSNTSRLSMIDGEKRRISEIEGRISYNTSEVERLSSERDELRRKHRELKSATFSETTCRYCGAKLSDEKVAENMAAYNREKESELSSIQSKGKILSDRIDALRSIIDTDKESLKNRPDIPDEIDIDALRSEYDRIRTETPKFDETERGRYLKSEIEKAQGQSNGADDGSLPSKISLRSKLDSLYLKLSKEESLKHAREELSKLNKRKTENGIEIAKYEGIIDKCKEYSQEKSEAISKMVNKGLKFANVSMWSRLKDGTLVPDLVITKKDGVRYETANGASRVLMCVDVQKMFCERLGVLMPVWVDECNIVNESNLPSDGEYQYVYMYCSDSKVLTIKKEK